MRHQCRNFWRSRECGSWRRRRRLFCPFPILWTAAGMRRWRKGRPTMWRRFSVFRMPAAERVRSRWSVIPMGFPPTRLWWVSGIPWTTPDISLVWAAARPWSVHWRPAWPGASPEFWLLAVIWAKRPDTGLWALPWRLIWWMPVPGRWTISVWQTRRFPPMRKRLIQE